jgi:dihydroflavonol-4-reductase
MISPAVDGTLRALRAAKKAGVKRVVLTSSIVSMMGSMKTGTFGPGDWTDVNTPDVSTYFKSKTLAEKAAWEFIKNQDSESPLELTVINPGWSIWRTSRSQYHWTVHVDDGSNATW